MAAVLDVSRSREGRRSGGKRKAFADPPPPKTYVEVTLAVKENGRALLILSSSTKEGRAEKESVEFTPHSPALEDLTTSQRVARREKENRRKRWST
eukprot:6213796-Pleurochrysis_carterae.AAC.3